MNHSAIETLQSENEALKKKQAETEASLTQMKRQLDIEAALERVRRRTMAMQRSEELPNAALVMFQQLQALGVTQFACSFNIWDDDKKASTCWGARGDSLAPPFKTSSSEDIFVHILEAAQRGETLYVIEQGGEELEDHYKYMASIPEVKPIVEELSKRGLSFPRFQIVHCAFFSHGYLMFITYNPVSEAHDIFKRFAKVFEQTYTRFLDLKKAEAQARESQIQAALERVRSRSMGMQKSDELKEVIQVVFEQFVHLNIHIEHTGFVMDYKTRDDYNIWVADPRGVPSQVTIPYFDSVYYNCFNEAKEKGNDFFATNLSFEEKNKFYQTLFRYIPELPEEAKEFYFSCPGLAASTVLLEDVALYIENFSGIPYSDQENATLMRFGKVFQQTYTRFLDLQKAEEQARESQVEAALERVRSRSMGMQKSEELRDVVQVIYEQFIYLGFNVDGAGFNVDIRDSDDWNLWMAHRFALVPTKMHIPYFDHPLANSLLQARNNGDQTLILSLTGEEKNRMLDHVFKYVTLSEDEKKVLYSTPGYLISEVLFKDVSLFIENYEGRLYTDSENAVLMRFGKAFEQSYVRFRDLKHAEAQAWEAKVEAGLERARTQSMLMLHSDELKETLQVFHQQVQLLGINSNFSFLWLPDEENDKHVFWTTWAEEINGSTILLSRTLAYPLDRNEHYTAECLADWKGGVPVHTYKVPPAELKNYFAAWEELLSGASIPMKPEFYPGGLDYVEAYMKYGCFGIVISRLLTDDEKEILRRFSVEFERAYTRFLDLQKAEAQAREAQIEAALERVRANVMAMKNSNELNETSLVFGEQLRKLGIDWQFSYFWLIEEDKDENTFWITWPDSKTSTTTYSLVEADASFKECITAWKRQDKIHFSFIPPEEVVAWLNTFERITADAGGIAIELMRPGNFSEGVFYYDAMIKFGSFGILSNRSINDEEKRIQSRFAVEFERAYTRFLDLKRVEAQALEAIKRASVDRVRAEIASMRTTNDLERITPLVWNELTILGVPFIRCGVFIMDEEHEKVHTFLSTPEGKAILSFTSAFSDQKIITDALPYWRRKEIYKTYWDEAAFLEQAKNLIEQGAISSSNTYLTENRPKNLYLHFLPFLQGILYVGNVEALSDEHLQLVQALGDAFSTAYARYEDFNKLESANLKIEKTLVDLKQTQAQLVQSEKMASLGELTAGIAHEIQNPLNFVNNFAEVNKELIAELKDEIEKGNYDEVKIIARDLINNEEKISHHGKRADAIVKGMLQHSRSTSMTKEPTDINKLADEYLRLAYHGLRAKDKLFNATMKCDYEEGIGSISIFPQDIGRVLLNLYNNAFYAVTEKKKQNGDHFQPLVQVTTQKLNGKVEITVKDNGNGIPQKVRDKIFQPFFTTKPTGQGTGLGLSLSYDIVKAHAGEIRVDTNEGEFTEFIIQLPA